MQTFFLYLYEKFKIYKMNKIKIYILGSTDSGKSSVLYLIKTILRKEGFTVIGDGGIDYISEEAFDKTAQTGINAKLDAIKQKAEINIFERQASTDAIENPWMSFNEHTPHVGQIFWSLDADNEIRLYRKTKVHKFGKKEKIYDENLLTHKAKQIDHIKWYPFTFPTLNNNIK